MKELDDLLAVVKRICDEAAKPISLTVRATADEMPLDRHVTNGEVDAIGELMVAHMAYEKALAAVSADRPPRRVSGPATRKAD